MIEREFKEEENPGAKHKKAVSNERPFFLFFVATS
jgi:hypothetical protein